MSSVKDIYKMLFVGQTVKIKVDSVKEKESLRVALAREHQLSYALDLVEGSLCSSFDSQTSTASFWIGTSRAKRARTWTIIDDGSETESE